jgi:hypothetical protein
MTQMPSARRTDDGAALVLALLLAMALSAIAVSLIFLSETETMASVNYRLMSQARYGAEAGIHKSINHLLNNYAKPGTAGDPIAAYDLTVSPVTFGGTPVVLSSVAGVVNNYPVGAAATAFTNAAQGTLAVGGYNVQYTATATLLSMRQIPVYGSGSVDTIMTWRITAIGQIAGPRPAQVEVTSLLEQQAVPSHTYGVFATNPTCGAVTFTGGSATDSYDSTAPTFDGSGNLITQSTNGDVGTNGNLTVSGNATINGSLSTPRSGVGNCHDGAVNALTELGQADVTGSTIQLPQTLTYPTPASPNPLPPTGNQSLSSTCAAAGIAAANCSGPSGNLVLNPAGGHLLLGDVRLAAGATLHLQAGVYDINSIALAGNSNVVLDSGPVILNVVGTGQTTPIDFTGGTLQNPTFKPGQFEILYPGDGNVKISGGTSTAAMVFAPNAAVSLHGGSHFYGAILGATVTDTGGTHFHYDRSLQDDFFVIGNWMLSAFSWKKY